MTRGALSMQGWLSRKRLSRAVVTLRSTGSFDCVRLTPHFAQDDRVVGRGFSFGNRWRWWIERLFGAVVTLRSMGSFDCVRLTPHCAQDDRVVGWGIHFWKSVAVVERTPLWGGGDIEEHGVLRLRSAYASLRSG
jgi:hypothetical protein